MSATPNNPVPAPCGYCRRCAVHDDPGGCLTVQAWEHENPEAAIAAIQAAGMAFGQYRVEELERLIEVRKSSVFAGFSPEAQVRIALAGSDPFDRAEAAGEWDEGPEPDEYRVQLGGPTVMRG